MKMEPAHEEFWVLNYLNADRSKEDLITMENARGRYLPRERFYMGRTYYKEGVNRVLGEPSHLERAEMMLLEIEEDEISLEKKCENLICIVYAISESCKNSLEMSSGTNSILEKYVTLYKRIPIQMWHNVGVQAPMLKKEEKIVSADFLKLMKKTMLNSVPSKSSIKEYVKYFLEALYISLKKIFEEVKKEIRG